LIKPCLKFELIFVINFKMTEEIEAHVLKKYEILQKLGKSKFTPQITRPLDGN